MVYVAVDEAAGDSSERSSYDDSNAVFQFSTIKLDS